MALLLRPWRTVLLPLFLTPTSEKANSCLCLPPLPPCRLPPTSHKVFAKKSLLFFKRRETNVVEIAKVASPSLSLSLFLLFLFATEAPCVVPHVSHGFVADRASGSSVPHSQTIDVHCLSQFQKTHNSTPVCKNGTWSRIPKCVPGNFFVGTVCVYV